uniref:G-protein coupled receptors family 1 profile domain-containing protein n=1 Tax=Biomphalaria glabrata TaxID=6526 RepID=A0A2C9M8P8_BIOGL
MVNNSTTDLIVSEAIAQTYLWFLCGIGIPANTLAIIVILTMQSMTPATFLIASLAFFDGTALIVKLVVYLMDVYATPPCKTSFIVNFFSMMTNWTLAYVCLERFISVCYPLKKIYLVTLLRCVACVAITAAAMLSYFVPVFSLMFFWNYNDTSCWVHNEYDEFYFYYHRWINETLVLFIPYTAVVVLTFVIVVKLKVNAKQRRKSLQSTGSANSKTPCSYTERVIKENERVESTLTIMLICTAILFIVLTLPSFLYFIIDKNSLRYPLIFKQLKYILYDSTHAFNFFIYFFSAAKFRCRFYKLIGVDRCRNGCKNESDESREGEDDMSPNTHLTNFSTNQ